MIGRKGKGTNVRHARHGDVCIEVLNEKPKNWENMSTRCVSHTQTQVGDFIVAYGESTGHSHSMAGGSVIDAKEERDSLGRNHIYVQVKGKPKIKHQEHDPIEFEETDTWLHFISQYEFSPEELRRVRD